MNEPLRLKPGEYRAEPTRPPNRFAGAVFSILITTLAVVTFLSWPAIVSALGSFPTPPASAIGSVYNLGADSTVANQWDPFTVDNTSGGLVVKCASGCTGGAATMPFTGGATGVANGPGQGVGIFAYNGTNNDALQESGGALNVRFAVAQHTIVDTAPTTAVTGTFWQATQPISGSVGLTGTLPGYSVPPPVAQSGTWTVQPGNTANTTPWLATISQGGNAATVSATGALKVDNSAVTQPVSGNTGDTLYSSATGTMFPAYGVAPAGPQTCTSIKTGAGVMVSAWMVSPVNQPSGSTIEFFDEGASPLCSAADVIYSTGQVAAGWQYGKNSAPLPYNTGLAFKIASGTAFTGSYGMKFKTIP
jgi:hypothetical protein